MKAKKIVFFSLIAAIIASIAALDFFNLEIRISSSDGSGIFAKGPAKPEASKGETVHATDDPEVKKLLESNQNFLNIFAKLAEKLRPTVVNIYTTQTMKNPMAQQGNDLFRRFFEDFFGEMDPRMLPREREARSLGTGFVIDSGEGLIVTNNHVISAADEIEIVFLDQASDAEPEGVKAKVVGRDPGSDLALIQVEKEELTKKNLKLVAAPLGDSDKIRVGDWVLAIGNPFGHEHSVTHGIVSSKGRPAVSGIYRNIIQTDAAINPGNSGGPLFNLRGEVIGVNYAIDARGPGIGFAIPINTFKGILSQLREKGSVSRGYLGVGVQPLTQDISEALGLPKDTKGVQVVQVVEGEAAAKAGLKPYDVITKINNETIESTQELIREVTQYEPGEKIDVVYYRDGVKKELKITLSERPDFTARQEPKRQEEEEEEPINTGLALRSLDSNTARQYGIPAGQKGVLVVGVKFGSPAYEARISRGDIIVEVDRKSVATVKDFYELVEKPKKYLLRIKSGDDFRNTILDLSGS
jgi:serine protease Do